MTTTRPIQVLVVDDNPADADLIRDSLEMGAYDLRFEIVANGSEALDYLHRRGIYERAQPPDIVLLDLNLPGITGLHVLAEIRLDTQLKHIPVVMLTSSEAESDIVESYRLGANCYVAKTIDLKQFQSNVRGIEGFWFAVAKLPPGSRRAG